LTSKVVEKPPPPSQKTKPNLIKSTSVPAILSSSHATPTLSSTASLARPTPQLRKAPAPRTFAAIAETPAPAKSPVSPRAKATPASSATAALTRQSMDLKSPAAAAEAKAAPDMAFGQARLRDLIKKYQGQAAK
jgi:hypothetical protein